MSGSITMPAPGPQMPPQGGPPPAAPQVSPRLPPPGMAKNLAMFGASAQGGGKGGPPRLTPQEMAALGRNGDQIVAHLTPGEIEVPPQVQTPKLLATLDKAFDHAGVPMQNFVAGSPSSSVNPITQTAEYNYWASILPMVLGGVASVAMPAAAPAILGAESALGATGGAALSGALGSAVGSAIGGGTPGQIGMSAIGGGLGGAFGAGGSGAAGAGSDLAAKAAANGLTVSEMPAGGAAAAAAPGAASSSSGLSALLGKLPPNALKTGLYTGMGASMGASMVPGKTDNTSPLPPGFSNSMPALNPNYNSMLGNGNVSSPQFAGYNPIKSVTGGHPYNFFQPGSNGPFA